MNTHTQLGAHSAVCTEGKQPSVGSWTTHTSPFKVSNGAESGPKWAVLTELNDEVAHWFFFDWFNSASREKHILFDSNRLLKRLVAPVIS